MKIRRLLMQKTISNLFAILLTFLFTVLYIGFGFLLGFFNNLSITRAINESNFYNTVYDDLYQSSEEIITSSNLPIAILSDVVTMDYVYMECKNYVDKALSGQVHEVNSLELKSKLSDNIRTYYHSIDNSNTTLIEEKIKTVTDRIGAQYEKAVKIELANEFNRKKAEYESLIQGIVFICILLIGIISFILLKIHKYKHRGIRYIIYSLGISTGLVMIAATLTMLTKVYTNINIKPDYYNKVVNAYIRWDMILFIYMGCISIVVGAGLIYYSNYLKNKIIE